MRQGPEPNVKAMSDLARLRAAWQRVWRADGCHGGDGQTLAQFRNDVRSELARLGTELAEGSYEKRAARRISIPKPDGSERLLLVPSVRDRVAQHAALGLLGPYLEPAFESCSFAYRPGRSHKDALRSVQQARAAGYRWIAEGDVEKFFDRVDRRRLLELLHQAGIEDDLIALVAHWIDGRAGRGIPQGSPISPLLSNLYLDAFDEGVSDAGFRLIRFADDFVIVTRSATAAGEAILSARRALRAIGLGLKPAKTAIRAPQDGFVFLGSDFDQDGYRPVRPHRPALPRRRRERGDGWHLELRPAERAAFRHHGRPDPQPQGRSDPWQSPLHGGRQEIAVSTVVAGDTCPHIVYRRIVLGERPDPDALRAERAEHGAWQAKFPNEAVEVTYRSRRLGLVGRVDLVEQTGDTLTVVDLKPGLARSARTTERIQLAAYGLLVAEVTGHWPRLELAFTGSQRRESLAVDDQAVERVRRLTDLSHRIADGRWAPSDRRRPACRTCLHRSACQGAR